MSEGAPACCGWCSPPASAGPSSGCASSATTFPPFVKTPPRNPPGVSLSKFLILFSRHVSEYTAPRSGGFPPGGRPPAAPNATNLSGQLLRGGVFVAFMSSIIGKRTLREQVEVCEPLLEDRLAFTDKALKSLDAPPSGFGFVEVMAFLVPLYTRLYPSYVSPFGRRREDLLEGLPIDYTANEGNLTMDTGKFRRDRTVVHKGMSYVCEEHLKMSKGDARLYFTYSKKEKKIVICHIGRHLDTAGTKKRGH